MQSDFGLLIDGATLSSSGRERVTVINPANGDAIGDVAFASVTDLERAIATAVKGLREWQAVAP